MKIEKVEQNKEIEDFIEKSQEEYEKENGIDCNYTPFVFVAKDEDRIVGALSGATFFAEVYIDELVVDKESRGKGIGRLLMNAVEDYYRDSGFNNINTCTNGFQEKKKKKKCGFELEFVRKNKTNPKLDKYFYVKYF